MPLPASTAFSPPITQEPQRVPLLRQLHLAVGHLAEGAPSIPPPRSVGELAKLNEIYRKASGLDGRHASGDFKLVRPMRSLRRGSAVEVEVVASDPLEGFEI